MFRSANVAHVFITADLNDFERTAQVATELAQRDDVPGIAQPLAANASAAALSIPFEAPVMTIDLVIELIVYSFERVRCMFRIAEQSCATHVAEQSNVWNLWKSEKEETLGQILTKNSGCLSIRVEMSTLAETSNAQFFIRA